MKPVNYDRIAELISGRKARSEPPHSIWFVGSDGEPAWSQLRQHGPLMTEMTIQPWAESPRYRVLSFEDYPDTESVTVVRVEMCDANEDRRGPIDICEISPVDSTLEDEFPPRLPDGFRFDSRGDFPPSS